MNKTCSFVISIISFLYLGGCSSQQKLDKADNVLSEALQKPLTVDQISLVSRYWNFDDQVVHFISNINEKNKDLTPLIYVHGLGGTLADYLELIRINNRDNASKPYFAIDLPPFGRSVASSSEISIHRYAQILQGFISSLQSKKVNLVCHSMGGQVCIDLALNNPDAIQLLTLISPAGVYERSAYINQTLNHYIGITVGSFASPNARSINDLTWYNQNLTRKVLTDNPLVLAAIESYRDNFHGRIKDLKTKTLIIWGRKDVVFSFENGLYLNENIENSKLYIIDDADHFPLKSHADYISNLIQRNL